MLPEQLSLTWTYDHPSADSVSGGRCKANAERDCFDHLPAIAQALGVPSGPTGWADLRHTWLGSPPLPGRRRGQAGPVAPGEHLGPAVGAGHVSVRPVIRATRRTARHPGWASCLSRGIRWGPPVDTSAIS